MGRKSHSGWDSINLHSFPNSLKGNEFSGRIVKCLNNSTIWGTSPKNIFSVGWTRSFTYHIMILVNYLLIFKKNNRHGGGWGKDWNGSRGGKDLVCSFILQIPVQSEPCLIQVSHVSPHQCILVHTGRSYNNRAGTPTQILRYETQVPYALSYPRCKHLPFK